MHVAGRVLVLRCRGAVDGSAPSVHLISQEAKSRNTKVVVVDTTQAAYADTAGLRWLIALQNAIEEAGRQMRVVACHGAQIWRTLALLRPMTERLQIFSDMSSAWRSRSCRRDAECPPGFPSGVERRHRPLSMPKQ
jgi:anti-anti-sigma regulatory factor